MGLEEAHLCGPIGVVWKRKESSKMRVIDISTQVTSTIDLFFHDELDELIV